MQSSYPSRTSFATKAGSAVEDFFGFPVADSTEHKATIPGPHMSYEFAQKLYDYEALSPAPGKPPREEPLEPYSLQWFLNIENQRHSRQGRWIPNLRRPRPDRPRPHLPRPGRSARRRRATAPAAPIRRGLTPDIHARASAPSTAPPSPAGSSSPSGATSSIASERATFADTHARVGVLPAGGMTIRLPQLIGVNRARQMSLTGTSSTPPTACAWGLVNEVVPHDELLPRALASGRRHRRVRPGHHRRAAGDVRRAGPPG